MPAADVAATANPDDGLELARQRHQPVANLQRLDGDLAAFRPEACAHGETVRDCMGHVDLQRGE
jgi:hypothetical protein